MEEKGEEEEKEVGVVVIPLPAQGHLSQLLQLSHLLTTKYSIPVHFLCSATHIRQAKTRSHYFTTSSSEPPSTTTTTTSVQFHELIHFLPSPPSSSSHHHKSPFPTNLQSILQSLYLLGNPISQFLNSISSKFRRLILIHDSLMASVVEHIPCSIPNVESYTYHTSSAFAIFFTMLELMVDNKQPSDLHLDHLDSTLDVPSSQNCSTPEFHNFLANQYQLLNLSCGRLYNTCHALETKYLHLLQQLPVNLHKNLFAIGPIHPFYPSSNTNFSTSNHRCLEWLDEQEKESVIYVSFGTTTTMSEEQIEELANGLEKSKQKFIWVVREADGVDIFKEKNRNNNVRSVKSSLGNNEVEVKGGGVVISDWAPQVAILGHPSVGGFLSHCGWNSCIESISMGVPIAAWPIHSDQPKNSILVTQVWKAGVMVRDWSLAGDALVESEVIAKAVTKLMSSKEGQDIRGRARKLGAAVRNSISNRGSSCLEMDAFVAHITR